MMPKIFVVKCIPETSVRNTYFNSPAHEKSWIIRTTINACKDHLRTAFWKRSQTIDAILEIPAPNAPESELLDLVMCLPRNYRISIYLHYYEGYQVKEIAAMYGNQKMPFQHSNT